jgi:hypothetical protein
MMDAATILQVRRWTGEVANSSYTDAELTVIIERYPTQDADGEDQLLDEWDEGYTVGSGGTPVLNPDWTPTYDLHAAAADVWDEKAADAAKRFTFSADGASYNRNEVYRACVEQGQMHRSLSSFDQVKTKVGDLTDAAEQGIAFEDWESGEEI